MENKFLYSIGNKKLGPDTLIFNITSATDCPSKARGLCRHAGRCYAMKAERMYKAVLPYRRRQAAYWQKTPAVTIAGDIIAALRRHKAVKYIRFSESGDFCGQKDVNKLSRVVNLVQNERADVVFYGYTARRDLVFTPIRGLVVNGSGFMVDNKYTAVEKYSASARRCGERVCATCTLCKRANGVRIENLYH